MTDIIILLLGGGIAICLIAFIASIANSKDEITNATTKEGYNYRLCTFSRIVYFIALIANFVAPACTAYYSTTDIALLLFLSSPCYVFGIQNIMAHKLRDHNISLHFIALCAAILSVVVVLVFESGLLSFQIKSGFELYPLALYFTFTAFYALFAWIVAFANRNN